MQKIFVRRNIKAYMLIILFLGISRYRIVKATNKAITRFDKTYIAISVMPDRVYLLIRNNFPGTIANDTTILTIE